MYQYKCVPAPTDLIIKKPADIGKSVEGFGNLINANTSGGWEFYSMEQIACTKPAGCLAGLFGKKEETTYVNMLIFRKEL
jgi:hypothetical protein